MIVRKFIFLNSLIVALFVLLSCSKVTAGGDSRTEQPEEGQKEEEHPEEEKDTIIAHITVGSYNVWNIRMRDDYYQARDDKDAKWYFDGDGVFVYNDPRLWRNSKKHIGKAIMEGRCDVFAVTEIDETQMVTDIHDVVRDAGGNYSWIFMPLNGKDAGDGYDVIAYNPDVFIAGTHGTRWLSDIDEGKTPTVYGISEKASATNHKKWNDTNKHRTFSYANLTHKLTGKTIMFCTCHGPLNDDWNTYAGSNYIPRYVAEENKEGYPVIFVGDLNSCPYAGKYGNGRMYDELKKIWKHAYDEASSSGILASDDVEYPCTWESQRGQKSMLKSADYPFKHQLDHIFYSNDFLITRYKAIRYVHKERYSPSSSGYRNFFPSDHIPVIASFDL